MMMMVMKGERETSRRCEEEEQNLMNVGRIRTPRERERGKEVDVDDVKMKMKMYCVTS